MAARAAHQTPQQRKTYPTHHPVSSQTHKTIDTQVKPVYPRSIGPPPPAEAPMHRRPPHQSRAQAHAPTMPRRHTNQDPSPPGPAVTPTRRQSAPRSPNPPPDQPRNSAAARLATYVRRHRLPSSAACRRQRNRIQESPIPHPGQGRSPSAEPPKKPTPREPPDAPGPYCHPRQQQKPQPDRSGPPPTLGDGADQRSPERLI